MKDRTEGRPIWNTDFEPSKVPRVNNENGAFAVES